MGNFNIEIVGLDKLQNLAEKFPVAVEKNINIAINNSLQTLQSTLLSKAVRGATGDLRRMWDKKIGRFEGTLTATAPYASGVEFGTSPHYVNPQGLVAWVRFKGMDAGAIYPIAKSIAKKGTMPHPFMQSALDYTKPFIDKFFKTAMTNVLTDSTK